MYTVGDTDEIGDNETKLLKCVLENQSNGYKDTKWLSGAEESAEDGGHFVFVTQSEPLSHIHGELIHC